MKELNLFVCEYCNTQYKDKQNAAECENKHKHAKKIKNEKHHANGDYPDKVEVVFDDGTSIWYKR